MKTQTLGQLVKRRRQSLALSQREVARKVGIRASYVAYIENGSRRPSIAVLRGIADALGLDKRELFLLAYPEASDLIDRDDEKKLAQAGRSRTGSQTGPPAHAGLRKKPPVLRRFRPDFRWEGVKLEPYKLAAHRGGDFRSASRQVLSGGLGERGAFHVRYFELEPGGFTSLERHRHCHFAIGVRGRGIVRVGKTRYRLGRLDAIYIGPDQPHQLAATGSGRFGFFCIVDAQRDQPRPAT